MYDLHGFCQSGNTFKVAFMLNALEQPWRPVYVDFMNGATRDPQWRAQTNEMGEAPVLYAGSPDGPLRLTQSGMILEYLAERHGRFAGRDAAHRREILRWMFFDNHKFTSYFATYRFMKAFGASAPDPAIMGFLRARIEAAFGIVNRHLAAQPFMAGDAPTIADFSLCGYLFYPVAESGFDWPALYPDIAAWVARMKALPGWADPYDLLPGERIAPRW